VIKIGKWDARPVSEMCSEIIDCVNKTAPSVEETTPFKMIRTTNVRDGWVDAENVKYVKEDVFERWVRRGRPHRGDVILTREAPLGAVGMLRSDDQVFLGQRTVMYRADEVKADERFLLYALMSPWVQAEIRSLGSGAVVEHMRVPDCERLLIPAPPLRTQKRIGAALGAFDDLIENNRRRVEILEEMARLLYREWFLRFRFPGYEDVELVDSELGPIPEGWAAHPFSTAVEVNPRLRVDKDADDPFITMGDLSGGSMLCAPSEWKTGNSGSKFQNDDTLFARITPCLENGKTGFVHSLEEGQVGRGSTEFLVFRGRLIGAEHTYLLARDPDLRETAQRSMSGASGRQRVQNECFDSYLVAVPPKGITTAFARSVNPLFELAGNLFDQNRVLRDARDLLLPRLVSGELDVSDLDLDGVLT
jgi:type I restriction enzyme S subunit